jgi:hypothetical protein
LWLRLWKILWLYYMLLSPRKIPLFCIYRQFFFSQAKLAILISSTQFHGSDLLIYINTAVPPIKS